MTQENGMRLIGGLKWLALGLLALPLAVGAYMGVNQLAGNFHTVIPGELYRSAQPSAGDIAAYARQYGIRTILNLRNERRSEWYSEEAQAAKKAGITLIDYPISSDDELPISKSQELAQLMANAQKPLLIHCEHGANRTGLASAIYVGAVKKDSEAFAEFQLSPFYGHVPVPGLGRYEMYRSWDDYEETIGF
jgi:protein tyrosine/serine phosphatase